MNFEELLELHGLSIEILNELSFESHLPFSLRDDLGKVDKNDLLNELQFNTFYDRQLNNYLHDYIYKKEYPKCIGGVIREFYEKGKIRTLEEFKEVLEDVLHSGEGHKCSWLCCLEDKAGKRTWSSEKCS